MGATNYQFQKNVNNGGWETIQAGTVADASQAFTYNIDANFTDNIQFRVLLEDLNVPLPYDKETDNGSIITIYPSVGGSTTSGAVIRGEWTEETGIQTIRGKCSSAYERQQSFRVEGDAPFLVRVTRVTPDSTTAYLVNKTYFSSIAYAIEEKFRYPGSVLVATKVSAEQFSSIPTRAYRCKMLKVKIPTNYNPLTRAYSGVWDGTFKVAWTNNPAWCFYDLITNTRYGLGERIPASSVDKWSLYEIAQYCDELVPTSDGTMEPRFTCNVLIQTREEAYRVISDFASIFRGMTYWGNGTIVAVQDSPKIPAYAFTNANVVDGLFEYQSTNISTRYNTCAVTWNNLNDFGRRWVEYIEDTEAIARLGYVNETQVVAFGCTSRGMAQRVGRWLLYTNNYETDLITFSTGLEGVLPRPGEAIQVSDSLRSQDRRGGRIKSSTLSEIVIDNPFTFVLGKTYTVSVIGSDGVLQENTYTHSGETDTLTFTTPFASEIAKDSIYIIADDTIEPQIFKVVSVSEGDNNKYTITALSHNPTKYNYIERGYPLEDLALPNALVYPVIDLKAIEVVYASGTAYKSKIEVSWKKPSFASSYNVTVRSGDGRIWKQNTKDNFFVVDDVSIGAYEVKVSAVTVLGKESQIETTSVTTVGKTWNSSDVTSGSFSVQSGTSIALVWEPVADIDVAGYEVRKTNSGWNTNDISRVFYGKANSCYIEPTSTSETFYVKAFDNLGHFSTTAYAITTNVNAPVAPTSITYAYADSSTTDSTVTIKWVGSASSDFNISHYSVVLQKPGGSVSTTISGTEWTTRADWVGDATISIRAVNIFGWQSNATQATITKQLPQQVGQISVSVSGTKVALDWPDTLKTSLPVGGYEVRLTDANWGGVGFLFKGSVSGCSLSVADGLNTWYVKAFDTDSNYSGAATTATYNVVVPNAPLAITASFADTSTTSAAVTLQWDDVVPVFGLSYYKVEYEDKTFTTNSNFIVLPADWIGNRLFSVQTVDRLGNESVALQTYVEKLLPNPVLNFRTQVIDNNVLLYWDMPVKTTLPISHVLIKKGSSWATANSIGSKSGSFTSFFEAQAGDYTYWACTVDTDSNESVPVPITTKVSQPPDYVLHGSQASEKDGTLSNAVISQGSLVMPVNTTETWEQHFTSRGWTTPSAQISAGYPVYIQPSVDSGYYEEVFDFASVFAGTKVTVNYYGTTVANSVTVRCDISLSDDNVNWDTYTGQSEVYGTNFRYVKVRITVDTSGNTGVYELMELNVRLDAKLKNDAGQTNCLATDVSGTIANFSSEYVDITSITVTASGTTPTTAVYDFHDVILNGTYSVSSNVATINAVGHSLIAGQKVRLYFTSGTAVSGVYIVASVVNAGQYTVAIPNANTSGNLSTYPQSCRIYLFDNNGNRVSGTASWSLKGY